MNRLDESYRHGLNGSPLPLLQYAVLNVPYYTALKTNSLKLSDFPVVDKYTIRKNQDLFLSKQFNKNKLIAGKTTGSNGVPFSFYWCQQKALSRTAEVIYYNRWVGYNVGDAHLLNAVGLRKSKLKLFLQREIIANPRLISDEWLEQQKRDLVERKIPFYIGYGSVIDRFSRYCEFNSDTKQQFALKGIISTAEQLSEQARNRAEAVFGCPVLRRYATLETGVLAHECPEQRRLHVNSENYLIEFLKLDSNQPAKAGEISRIVVTDLYAFAMPLIRYSIGDLAVVDEQDCACGRKGVVIKEFTGRRSDSLLGQQGQIVSWVAVSDIMWSFPEIEQFQVVQMTRTNFVVNVVAHVEYDKSELILRFRSLLGDSINIELISVDEIDRLESGKAHFLVNKMQPESLTA